ncbi:hypothetical protein LILPAPAWES_60 [Morganella phage vB_MmoP_Lilpapawes]|uniref:Uncharacterized protein n=1 Tax=Morganella phage vB_MmoP_Lilpapawes TaxID=2894803 RepID=A0AAE8YNX8_9CAUD|nr:hypothetical protein LILPAPAWES_60 [Morganella phage vB_MmoP_Lilpapawes]
MVSCDAILIDDPALPAMRQLKAVKLQGSFVGNDYIIPYS